jgi:hypothetical protein
LIYLYTDIYVDSANSAVERLTKADYELLAAFRYALRKFLGFSENAAIKNGLSPQQYQVLLAIEGFPGRNWSPWANLPSK